MSRLGWSKLAIGLLFFDILLIIMVGAFALDDVNVGSYDYENEYGNFSSADNVDFDTLTIFDTFTVRFYDFPWWFYLLFTIFQIAMVTIIIAAFVRGVS